MSKVGSALGGATRAGRHVDDVVARGVAAGDVRALQVIAEAAAASGREVEQAGVRHESRVPTKRGRPVFNRRFKLHRGSVLQTSGRVRIPPLSPRGPRVSKAAALERARALARIRELRGDPTVERGWLALESETVPAWRVTLPAGDPFGTWQVLLDARSGELFAIADLVRYATGTGRVYDPNRVLSGDVTSLVPLHDLDESGHLAGRVTRVIDERQIEAFRPDLTFDFPPADERFVQTSVYRGLTDTGRFAEGHGFPAFVQPLLAFTNLPGPGGSGEFNNAFYDPTVPAFGFGNGDGVVLAELGTDLDVASHEMGHHVFEELADPLILTSADPILAMHEGVADTVTALLTGDPEIGESVVPGQPFLRTLDNARRFPDDLHPDPHVTGLIFGGLNWDLIQALGSGAFADLLVASLPFLPPDPVFDDSYLDALLDGDQALNAGAHDALIRNLGALRGLESIDDLGLQGFVLDGVPVSRNLANDELDFYFFAEFPGSPSVQLATTGTGDVDLIVIGVFLPFDPNDDSTFEASLNFGSTELVVLDSTSTPSVHDDDLWLVAVADYPNDGVPSSYTLTVNATLPPPDFALPANVVDSIDALDDVDAFLFDGALGDVVRVEASALTPGFDPLVGVVDAHTGEALAANDDSGPGLDALIQGVRLPATDRYAIVVISAVGDVDPGSTGSYELTASLCQTFSANHDGDLLVDACDDDDDNDGFLDDVDLDPLDPSVCEDLDDDLCDDCSSGAFDPLDDGPDNDLDSVCDAGDPDDDNDGCVDVDDPKPLAVSLDDDLDFVGADCDNCPALANPDQDDTDADLLGDACDPCPLDPVDDSDNDGLCADDNCPFAPNPLQLDTGALRFDPPDGVGDACQCGDLNDDGVVDIADAAYLERELAQLPPGLPAPEKCGVIGLGCDSIDLVVLRGALAGLFPIQAVCDAALLRRALDLNGADEHLANLTPQPLGLANAWTLSAWIKPRSLAVPMSVARFGPPDLLDVTSSIRLDVRGDLAGAPFEVLVGDAPGSKLYGAAGALATDAWTHLAATWDGAELALYADGHRVPDAALDKIFDAAPVQDDVSDRIAHAGFDGVASHFDGHLGHLALWSDALPPVAILQVHSVGHAIDLRADFGTYQQSADLVHYWRPGHGLVLLAPDLAGALDLGADAANLTPDDDAIPDAP